MIVSFNFQFVSKGRSSVILAQSLLALLYFQQSIIIDQARRLNNVPALNNL